MFQKHVGIDLGTTNVLVYVKGKGIVFNEPSVVALGVKDNRLLYVGNEARDMIGRTPQSINIVYPVRDGVIADFLVTERLLRHFLSEVTRGLNLLRPQVMICVPAGITSVEQRAVKAAAEQAGAKRPAHLIPEPLAAALGAKIPIGTPSGNMVVAIGGGTTDAAVISMYGIVCARSCRIGGNKIDESIIAYLKRKHNLVIGERTAEEVKVEIGSAVPLEDELSMEVRGRDQVTGMPRTILVTSKEVAVAIAEPLNGIVATVKALLEETPPELASDIIDRGIILTGGGALLRNIDRLLAEESGVPCYVADSPTSCVAVGAGLALEHLDVIKRNLPNED
ncbi:MAG: rod shape-determining protein [Chloroflexota bacterium]|nr:MAG: rod shape-determining protein [Chloroflexota bacterium]